MKSLQFCLVLTGFFAVQYLDAEDIVLESGPYKVHLAEEFFYCSAQYFYQGVELGGRKGFYGTILTTTGRNKFIGAGHQEGGCEKMISLEIDADGKKQEIRNRTYSGNELKVRKVSMLGNLKTIVRYTITPSQIVINKQYEAVEEQPIRSFYIFQFCWSNQNDFWMAGRPDGSSLDGKFLSNEGWFLCRDHFEPEILWFAEYNSSAQKGIIGYFSKYFRNQGTYMLWDRKRYHKFYFSAKCPNPALKGYLSPEYEMVLKGFSAGIEKWQETVRKETAKLQKQYQEASVSGK